MINGNVGAPDIHVGIRCSNQLSKGDARSMVLGRGLSKGKCCSDIISHLPRRRQGYLGLKGQGRICLGARRAKPTSLYFIKSISIVISRSVPSAIEMFNQSDHLSSQMRLRWSLRGGLSNENATPWRMIFRAKRHSR